MVYHVLRNYNVRFRLLVQCKWEISPCRVHHATLHFAFSFVWQRIKQQSVEYEIQLLVLGICHLINVRA